MNIMRNLGIHASEWAWVGSDFDAVIKNDSTIDDLYSSVESLVVTN
jgi:hypothetical protein